MIFLNIVAPKQISCFFMILEDDLKKNEIYFPE